MGVLNSLFGGGVGKVQNAANHLAEFFSGLLKFGSPHPTNGDLSQKREMAGFYYGMVIHSVRVNRLPPDEVDNLARCAFGKGFGLCSQDLDDMMKMAKECLHTEEGKGHIKRGAETLENAGNKAR